MKSKINLGKLKIGEEIVLEDIAVESEATPSEMREQWELTKKVVKELPEGINLTLDKVPSIIKKLFSVYRQSESVVSENNIPTSFEDTEELLKKEA